MSEIERKFINLAELKVSDAGTGSISGYRAVLGVIDEGGDLILPGAFKDTIEEYSKSGFTAHSHEWSFKDAVGFPVEVKEDSHGLFVKSQFHSTKGAQDVRTVAKERLAAGKTVGFSFGYRADNYEYIQAKDYKTQLPLYLKSDRLEVEMAKAQGFSQIRLLKKVSVIEDSLVTSPMNKLAMATGAKSDNRSREGRALHAQSLRVTSEALVALYSPPAVNTPGHVLRLQSMAAMNRARATLSTHSAGKRAGR